MNTPVQPTGTPPVQGSGTAQPTTAAGAVVERVAEMPPPLARALQSGAPIPATVAAQPQENLVLLRTADGAVTVRTASPPPPGTPVLLRATGQGPPMQVTMQTQPGQGAGPPPASAATRNLQGGLTAAVQAAPPASPAGPSPQVSAAAAQPAVVTTLTQGAVLTATVAGTGFALPAGAAESLPPAGPAPGSTGGMVAGVPRKAAAPAAQGGGAQGVSPSGGAARTLAAGTAIPVRIVAIAQPGGPAPAAAASGAMLTGTVTGSTAGGQTVVQTPHGQLLLSTGNAPPAGVRLSLEVVGPPRTPAAPHVAAPTGPALQFEALREAIAALQQGDAAAAQRLTQALLPQPGAQLGPALAFLILALRGNVVERWLGGDMTRTLERLRPGSVGRLGAELGSLTGRASDSVGQDWRSIQLPVLRDGDLEPIRLYIRDRPEGGGREGEAERRNPGRRFVVEANFTRLGPFQFDGMVREKHIDLMIRTHAPLPESMRREIHDLFEDTVTAMGYTGLVGFHVVKAFDLRSLDDRSDRHSEATA